jgi:hypothetical protein
MTIATGLYSAESYYKRRSVGGSGSVEMEDTRDVRFEVDGWHFSMLKG